MSEPVSGEVRLHREVFGSLLRSGDLIAIEGRYVYEAWTTGGVWRLTHWRLNQTIRGKIHLTLAPGGWYKIHGNKRKDMGALKLRRFTEPIETHAASAALQRGLSAQFATQFDAAVNSLPSVEDIE